MSTHHQCQRSRDLSIVLGLSKQAFWKSRDDIDNEE